MQQADALTISATFLMGRSKQATLPIAVRSPGKRMSAASPAVHALSAPARWSAIHHPGLAGRGGDIDRFGGLGIRNVAAVLVIHDPTRRMEKSLSSGSWTPTA